MRKQIKAEENEGDLKLVHVVPIRFRLSNRQLAHQFPLPEILDFGVNQFSQTFEVDAALGPGSHEQVPPDSGSGNRVVNAELQGTVEADHLLHQIVGAGIVCVRPRDPDGEPPSERPTVW